MSSAAPRTDRQYQGVRDQGSSATETDAAGSHTVQEAQRMQQDTQTAQSDAQAVGQEFQSMDGSIGEQELATMDGMTFLQDSMTSSDERLTAIAAEKQRLSSEHAAAEAGMGAWVQSHAQMRTAGMGDLDRLVELADPQGAGGGQ